MFKSIGLKISLILFIVLIFSFSIILAILYFNVKETTTKMALSNLNSISASVFQSMRLSMDFGMREKIDEAIANAKSIEGVADIRIYPSKEVIETFDMKNPQTSDEDVIKQQFKNPSIVSMQATLNDIAHLRLIRPLLADDSCIACHGDVKNGEVLGVMDIYHSLEETQRDLNTTSNIFIFIFCIALILTLTVIGFFLKTVVGKPILELLNTAKELSQGSGNLKSRLRIRGKDEIARACNFINLFIEKIQKTVSATAANSNNIEKQVKLLNTNASSLSQISSDTALKISNSYKTSKDVNLELNNLSQLSSLANEANDKSFALLNQMIDSLFASANKINTVASSESELASRVESMVEYADKIKDLTNKMDDIVEMINLLALNAGIEAARAGEHGRGFAVVADEVRNLAEKTDKSLADINLTVQSITSKINQNTELMQSIHESMMQTSSKTNDLQEEILVSLQSLDYITDSTYSMQKKAEVAKEKMSQLEENIKKVEDMQTSLKELSSELSSMSNTLLDSSKELSSKLNSFK